MRILTLIACGFAAACAVYVTFPFAGCCLAAGAILALIAVGIGVLARKRRAGRMICLLVSGAAAGLLWSGAFSLKTVEPAAALDGETGTLRVYAAAMPELTENGWTLKTVEEHSGRRIEIFDYNSEAPEVAPGELFEVTGEFHRADRYRNEKIYTYYAEGYFLRLRPVEPLGYTGESAPGKFWASRLSAAVKEQLRLTVPEHALPFLTAMLTGDRALLWEDEALTEAFSAAGISHMLAVSGMHVSVLSGAVLLFLGKRRWSAILAAAVALIFAAMTGFSPSVTRAFVMQLFVLMAPILNRENDAPTSLSVALAILTAENPYALASIGLQLSFLATFGLIWLAPQMREALLHPLADKKVKKSVPRFLRTVIGFVVTSAAATISALVMTAPVAAYYFGSVSVIAPLSNMIITPAGEAAFCLGGAATIIGNLWLPAGKVLGWLAGIFTEYVSRMALLFSRFPFAAVYTLNAAVWVWILFSSLLFILVRSMGGTLKSYLRAFAAVTVSLCVMLLFGAWETERENLSVTVLDVGQGQCVAAVSQTSAVVIDCGGSGFENPGDTAADYLRSRGVTQVSLLVLTHYHEDHVNGVPQLFARLPVEAVLMPEPAEADLSAAQEILQLANDHGCGVLWIQEDTDIAFGMADIHIWAPDGAEAENERGLALSLSCGEFDAVITGDLPASMEQILVRRGILPDAELLVAGHHGSKSSSCEEFLRALKPEAAAVSVGVNAYGQPAEETLWRLYEAEIAVYRTDEDGTVTFRMR